MNKKAKVAPKKKCFLITPIDEIGSITRRRVDQFMEHVYSPALKDQYQIIRADQISAPGKITTQVIDHILNDDLAVIDLTGFNPNVMYEMAIRHVARKPAINIFSQEENIPFDVRNFRSIPYDCTNLRMADYLVEEIKKAIKEINTKDYQTPQIIKHKLDLDTILKDPEEFVMLLKKHLPISKEDNPSSEILSSPLLSIATEIIPPTVNLGAEHSSLQNSFHRCSSCKHGFITEKNPWDITYTWAQEQYVTCPKCGNVDRV